MCNLYGSTKLEGIRKHWQPSVADHLMWEGGVVAPRKPGPFVRRTRDDAGYSRELVVGRWVLIPWFSKTANIKFSTNNARSEELASKASFKHPWARGQRCIIPADWFNEPNWESGKNVWWRFKRADVEPWGLAGLWNTWTDQTTGEVHESYTMLTIHANSHPLMSRMHRRKPLTKIRINNLPKEHLWTTKFELSKTMTTLAATSSGRLSRAARAEESKRL